MAANRNNPNPFRLEDHYDESFLLESDDEDETQIDDASDDIPRTISPSNQGRRMARPPSARHGSRSAHSTNSNRDAGYSGSYDHQTNGHNSRPVSGKVREPQPPSGPKREKSGNINLHPSARSGNDSREPNHHNHHQDRFVDEQSDDLNDDSSDQLGSETTDDDFNYQFGKDNQRPGNNSRPRVPEPPNNNSPNMSDSDSLGESSEVDRDTRQRSSGPQDGSVVLGFLA